MQYKFAEKLDSIGEQLKTLIKDCSDKATKVRDKIHMFQDHKNALQDDYFVKEIHKDSMKTKQAKVNPPVEWIRDETVLIKCEHYPITISDESSDEDHDVQLEGDMDTKFKYPKKKCK